MILFKEIYSMVINMDARDITLRNYIPYSKMTILDRAIPDGRDGLKPVQRRVLYSMHENNMYQIGKDGKVNKTHKSARIVGDTMGKYHPHGDSSIYGALVNMTDDYEDLLVPYIHGGGTFGRVWSDKIRAAASRYTEASLRPIARQLFDGLDENAVDFVPNFDNSEMEPSVLPAKFPSILVNSTNGVAVGISSAIPRYNLKAVCEATKALASGKVKSSSELAEILGLPDFVTGGLIHGSLEKATKLIETGRATFDMTGTALVGRNVIIIKQIPYNTTIDRIENELKEASVERIKEIKDVINSSGYDKKTNTAKLELTIELKSGCDVKTVLTKIQRYTSFRSSISFVTRVIMGDDCSEGKPYEIGVRELLERWIEWRQGIIKRQYEYKYKKEYDKEHLLSSWEKIKDRLKEFISDVTSHVEDDLVAICGPKYGLDADQTNYLISMQIKKISQDKLLKSLKELEESRNVLKYYDDIRNNKKSRLNLMMKQLSEIEETFGGERYTTPTTEVRKEEEDDRLAEHIDDVPVAVVVTHKGLAKKFVNVLDSLSADNLIVDIEDKTEWRINCKNTDTLLVFTDKGFCYKVPVHKIDNSGRTRFKESIWNNVERKDDGNILYIVNAGDFSGSFNVVYRNGKCIVVPLSLVSGNRTKYQNVFEDIEENGGGFITLEDKFFILTRNNKTNLVNLEYAKAMAYGKKIRLRITRCSGTDFVSTIIPFDKVPNSDSLDFSPYMKSYAVKIREDLPLFEVEHTEDEVEENTESEVETTEGTEE